MGFLTSDAFSWLLLAVCAAAALLYALIRRWEMPEGRASRAAVLVCVAMALAATVIGRVQRYVGAPMLGLIMGMLLVNLAPAGWFSAGYRKAAAFMGKTYLSFGIVLLGATLSFEDLFGAVYALPLIVFNMLLSFGVAYLVGGRLMGVSGNVCTLVGSGTCVCGGTAIAAISPVIGAEEEDTAYAMTAIFLFDMLACLGYPYFAMLIGMNSEQFGFLAGSAVNDTSSVVAAQETYAALNGLQDYALPTTIKVVRTTMIIVLTLIFSAVTARRRAREGAAALAGGRGASFWGALPKFIPVFLLMIVANTLLANLAAGAELYEEALQPLFSQAYKFMVTVALSAIGFKISFRELFTKGLRPIALGGCTWFAVFLSSLAFSLAFA